MFWDGEPGDTIKLSDECTLKAARITRIGYDDFRRLLNQMRTVVEVPAIVAGKRWLQTRCEQITLTDQRLILRRGILNRTTDYVELYRVKDSHFTQPLAERIFGLGTIRLRTTQDSEPLVVLAGMRAPETLWNQIRNLVEACRAARGVREVDMNTEVGG